MARTLELFDQTGKHRSWLIFCPACGFGHAFDSRWTFNGDVDRPTFRASMLIHEDPNSGRPRCHSFVTDGKIQYLADCTHAMRGQTVELPDF